MPASPRTRRGKAFIEAAATLDVSNTEAAVLAGYSPNGAHVRATELMRIPEVRHAIADRRSQAMREAGIELTQNWRNLNLAAQDMEANVRSSMVRANELILKAGGEIGADTQVNIDNRSVNLSPEDVALLEQRLREL